MRRPPLPAPRATVRPPPPTRVLVRPPPPPTRVLVALPRRAATPWVRLAPLWALLVVANYLGYVGKLFAATEAPLQKLTLYSLGLNGAWRLGLVHNRRLVAASATLGVGMLVAYAIALGIHGVDGMYGNQSWEGFDALDDVMVHLLFPLEAFVVAFFVRRVYVSYDALLELLLLGLVYVPFFLAYRPYSFVETLPFLEVLGLAAGTLVACLLLQAALVWGAARCRRA